MEPYSIAWPAPDIVICEQARILIALPTHDKTYCTFEKPKPTPTARRCLCQVPNLSA
jgi:hypothetical protein